MSDMVSGLAGQIFQKIADQQTNVRFEQRTGGQSFENVLQQTGSTDKVADERSNPNVKTEPVSAQTLEELRIELARQIREIDQSNRTAPDFDKLFESMMSGKSRLGMMREVYSEIPNTSKVTNDLPGRFVQVENEYKAVEAIMHSDKNLSSGQLLALQARLYQVGQHIEVMSKVVDQMAGGIKTILNTNV